VRHDPSLAAEGGTVFQITLGGSLKTVQNFDPSVGSDPQAGVLQDTNGLLYGTTTNGTSTACPGGFGTVYSLSLGLPPFVRTLPTADRVGTGVVILGTNLTGVTFVSFHGVPAAFDFISSTEITATVPAGATSGKIQAVLPTRTLASNVPFRVIG
jgi:IPT/TIG domain